MVLLEANERRAQFLERAVAACALQDGCALCSSEPRYAAGTPCTERTFDGVVARSFGAPAVVAECAAPFLRVGGWLIVSEPPSDDGPRGRVGHRRDGCAAPTTEGPGRWPADKLAPLGLEPTEFGASGIRLSDPATVVPCPDGSHGVTAFHPKDRCSEASAVGRCPMFHVDTRTPPVEPPCEARGIPPLDQLPGADRPPRCSRAADVTPCCRRARNVPRRDVMNLWPSQRRAPCAAKSGASLSTDILQAAQWKATETERRSTHA